MNFSMKIMCSCLIFLTVLGGKIEDHLIDISPVIRKVPTTHKVAALTFDDGPLKKTTLQILSVLREKNVKATFFVVGENAARFPALVSQEIAEGHEVGGHSYTHPRLDKLPKPDALKEIETTDTIISKYAPKPILFRPPHGRYNHSVLKMARENDYITILWSIDTLDWKNPSPENIVNTVLNNIQPGSIILLHDGIAPSPTPKALGLIIDGLKERGYDLVTVSELLQYYEAP